jgi:hypothetical protein
MSCNKIYHLVSYEGLYVRVKVRIDCILSESTIYVNDY